MQMTLEADAPLDQSTKEDKIQLSVSIWKLVGILMLNVQNVYVFI
jgi:hypothetical protein